MKLTTRNRLCAVTYFLCGATTQFAFEATAHAADDSLPARRVSYADLDISRPAGAKVLYHRIQIAAQQVCISSLDKDPERAARGQECVDRAVDTALASLDSSAMSQLRKTQAIHLAVN